MSAMAAKSASRPSAVKSKPKQRFTVRLFGIVGTNRHEMRVAANESPTGGFASYAIHTVRGDGGKRIKEESKGRGAYAKHDSFEAARSAADGLVARLVAIGWTGKAAKSPQGNFTVDSLPSLG